MGFREKWLQIEHSWNGLFEFCNKINQVHNSKNVLEKISKYSIDTNTLDATCASVEDSLERVH